MSNLKNQEFIRKITDVADKVISGEMSSQDGRNLSYMLGKAVGAAVAQQRYQQAKQEKVNVEFFED